MTEKLRLIAVFISAFLMTIFCFCINAFADNDYVELHLVCESDETVLSDIEWSIYLAAKHDPVKKSYNFVGQFRNYSVRIDDLSSASEIQDAADTLENYADIDNLKPMDTRSTDNEGSLKFDVLRGGIYLLTGERIKTNATEVVPAPMLIYVTEDCPHIFLVSYPKFEIRNTSEQKKIRYNVNKIWLNDENMISDRPESIELEIYCDNKLDRSIVMSDETDWSYSWEGEADSVWRIKEKEVPTGYTVVCRSDGVDFVVVNSHDKSTDFSSEPSTETQITYAAETKTFLSSSNTSTTLKTGKNDLITSRNTDNLSSNMIYQDNTNDETDISESETATVTNTEGKKSSSGYVSSECSGSDKGSKLPQTGQLWWPAPILASAGLISIVVGVKLREKES